MATAVDDTYSAASGATIYGGREAPSSRFTQPGIHDGDSLTAFSYQSEPARWGLPLTRKTPQSVRNFGTPNDTLQDMLDRQATSIAGATEAGAKWVIFRAGTNGAGGGDFLTKYAQLVDAFIAADLFVFCCQIPPTSSGGSTKVTQNTGVAAICNARPTMTAYVEDSNGMADVDYNVLSGMTSDGIHHNAVGQYTSGVAQAAVLDDYFVTDPRVVDSGGTAAQWVTNPLITGTGGSKSGGTGTVPDSWAVSAFGSGTAFVASVVDADAEDPVQVPWLRIELASAGGNTHSIEVSASLTHPAIEADYADLWSVDCVTEMRLVGLDSTNLTSIQAGPAFSRAYIQPVPAIRLTGNGTLNHTLVTREAYRRTAETAYSANTLKLLINIVASGAFASSAGYIDVRCASAKGFTI